MSETFRDIRLAFKTLVRERAFSTTVLATLALCIGANVAIFSVIHTVLLEPLPYDEPDELVALYNSYPGAGSARGANGTYDFMMRRERIDAFEEVAIYQGSGNAVGEPGSTGRVTSLRVSPSFFPLLRVEAELGRTFTDDEMDPGNDLKVVLSNAYWQEAYAGDPSVIGRDLRVDGQPRTIVGVLPEGFTVAAREDVRLFLPIALDERARSAEAWHSNSFSMLARLRDGATIDQARSQVAALNDALIDESPIPNARQLLADVGFETILLPAKEELVADVRPLLGMLWGGVGFVLLIGCVNIANLMLARSQVRISEVATRLALGAPRPRVARQVMTEALVLSVLGGLAGVAAGLLGLRFLAGFGADQLPRGAEIGIDGTVLAFTAALAVGAGLLFAAIPVVDVMRRDLSGVFRAQGRSGTASRGAVLLRNGMVMGQVGLAFVLLIGAGLMLVSFREAIAVDPGFEPRGIHTMLTSLPSARYPDADARRRFQTELVREVEALPGVEAASLTSQLPFSGNNSNSVIYPEGYVPAPGESLLSPAQNRVGVGYFATMGIEVLEGREFDSSDDPSGANVIVIDRWLADRYWPDESPLGQRLVEGVPGMDSIPPENVHTIVGVVETIKQNDLTASEADHVGAYYFPALQQPPGGFALVTRARAEVAASTLSDPIRGVVGRLDPEMAPFGVETMEDRISRSLVSRRTPMALLLVFSGVALFLAVIGIYGALAYSVTRRRREMGIRMAMGSDAGGIFGLVIKQGLAVTAVGLIVGIVASLFLTGLVQSLLFGVQPLDWRVIATVAVVLGAAAFVACALPAWRATRVDPMVALTTE